MRTKLEIQLLLFLGHAQCVWLGMRKMTILTMKDFHGSRGLPNKH